MNINTFLANTIYNLCKNSIDNIPREEWDELNTDINEYLLNNNMNEEINCQEIFSIKDDEYQKLSLAIEETFETYPLIKIFFEEHRTLEFPPLDMIGIIKRWCQDFVQTFEHADDSDEQDEEFDDSFSENQSNYSYSSLNSEIISNELLDNYITIKYFQGLFTAVYEMFMDRTL